LRVASTREGFTKGNREGRAADRNSFLLSSNCPLILYEPAPGTAAFAPGVFRRVRVTRDARLNGRG
jgi:hypothetical protein